MPLKEDVKEYFAREVSPFVPGSWIDQTYRDEKDNNIGRVGYELNFNRYFYRYLAPRPINVIDQELKDLECEIALLLKGIAG